jgi:pimeloyl-ACP methyl ester carboxylesterase
LIVVRLLWPSRREETVRTLKSRDLISRKRDIIVEQPVAGSVTHRLSRRSALGRLAVTGSAIAVAATSLGASQGAAHAAQSSVVRTKEDFFVTDATPTAGAPLTVVLVHGAFADGSSWSGVIELLQAQGIAVVAPPNPLRGISADSAYVASFINQVPGPVLAVGHSYGGAIITNAATDAKNVVGLVYVAAFAPDEGETLGAIEQGSKDSVLNSALMPLQYPTGQGTETATEFAIAPAKFHDAFAADVPVEQAAVLAAAQRPVAEAAFGESSGVPAWKNLPSWAVVATGDKAAGADVVRSMAERAGAKITELDGSHVIMISQPQAVTDVILSAIAAVS